MKHIEKLSLPHKYVFNVGVLYRYSYCNMHNITLPVCMCIITLRFCQQIIVKYLTRLDLARAMVDISTVRPKTLFLLSSKNGNANFSFLSCCDI